MPRVAISFPAKVRIKSNCVEREGDLGDSYFWAEAAGM